MAADYIQFGCGLCAPSTWRNFDASPTLRLQKIPLVGRSFSRKVHVVFPGNVEYGDIIRGLPVERGSCRAVYCSHVLEHLALDDFRSALRNVYSLLSEKGVFRFVLPDLAYLAGQYVQSNAANASLVFMEKTMLGIKSRPRGVSGFLRNWLGNSQHLWMWDYKSIELELQDAGFTGVRRAVFGDNPDVKFMDVEDQGRWANHLGVECHREHSETYQFHK